MLQRVIRSSIDIASTAVAAVLVGEADAAVHAEAADDLEDDVLRVDARREASRRRRSAGPSAGRARGTARRGRRAPATCRCRRRSRRTRRASRCGCRRRRSSSPGCVRPELGADDVDDALLRRCRGRGAGRRTPRSSARAPTSISSAIGSAKGRACEVGRDDVVDRGDGPLREGDAAGPDAGACRTPAGSSPRGRGGARRRAASGRSAACARRATSQTFEKSVRPMRIQPSRGALGRGKERREKAS